MNQEKISTTIKKIRKDNNLTQENLADELNVTYQAVSKWENGKSIPDIATLQIICKKYKLDINELLDTEVVSKKSSNILYLVVIGLVLIVGITIGVVHMMNESHTFETRELGTTCDNFKLSGTVSYDKSKTNIYISNIDYCGKEDNTTYSKIESILISTDNNIESVIGNGDTINNITLNSYLKELKFNVASRSCNILSGSTLKLVIKAYTEENKSTTYDIPLKLGDTTC